MMIKQRSVVLVGALFTLVLFVWVGRQFLMPGSTSEEKNPLCENATIPAKLKAMACQPVDQRWQRLDEQTIALNGEITSDSFEQFQTVFDDKVKVVILNSPRGETNAGIRIGMALLEAKVDVIVDQYCLSSCANYLFTAGQNKEIRNGIVGFHGNTIAASHTGDGMPWYISLVSPGSVDRMNKTIAFEKNLCRIRCFSSLV